MGVPIVLLFRVTITYTLTLLALQQILTLLLYITVLLDMLLTVDFRLVFLSHIYLANIFCINIKYDLFTQRRASKAFHRSPKTMFLVYFHFFAGNHE